MSNGNTTINLLKDKKTVNKSHIWCNTKVRSFKIYCTFLFTVFIK